MHLQFDDKPENAGRDDYHAFSDELLVWALALCTRVLKYLCEKFPRTKELDVFAGEVCIPKR